jgi:hypothetical protein
MVGRLVAFFAFVSVCAYLGVDWVTVLLAFIAYRLLVGAGRKVTRRW